MKLRKSILAMLLVLVPGIVLADDLYRWVDKTGKVHYGDTPTEDADRVNLDVYGSPSAASGVSADIPYESRMAAQHFPVTLYTASNCTTPCSDARNLLNSRHIPFSEKVLVTQDEIDAFKKNSGSATLPTLSVGRDWLQGFQMQQWQDELSAVGYPKK